MVWAQQQAATTQTNNTRGRLITTSVLLLYGYYGVVSGLGKRFQWECILEEESQESQENQENTQVEPDPPPQHQRSQHSPVHRAAQAARCSPAPHQQQRQHQTPQPPLPHQQQTQHQQQHPLLRPPPSSAWLHQQPPLPQLRLQVAGCAAPRQAAASSCCRLLLCPAEASSRACRPAVVWLCCCRRRLLLCCRGVVWPGARALGSGPCLGGLLSPCGAWQAAQHCAAGRKHGTRASKYLLNTTRTCFEQVDSHTGTSQPGAPRHAPRPNKGGKQSTHAELACQQHTAPPHPSPSQCTCSP